MTKLKLLKDQDDLEIELTKDKVINIIGTKGSGKTTLSSKYVDDDNYIVINCDRLFDLPTTEKEDKELTIIRDLLKEQFGVLKDEDFINYYDIIIKYINGKNKTAVIDGNVIQDLPIDVLKGKLIVKRTAKLKSFKRAVIRDFNNEYFMKLEKEKHKHTYKLTRLCKITKRRLKIFKQAKEIDEIVKKAR